MRKLLVTLAFLLVSPGYALGSPNIGPSVSIPDFGEQLSHKKKAKKKKKKKRGKKDEAPAPPADTDSDGIPDESDKCISEAEDIDLHEDEDGCPDPDNDGDGINDDDDNCPFEAENVDGWTDEDGCPEAAPAIAPMKISLVLNDGTKVNGTLIRITAVDEDDAEAQPSEPTQLEIAVGESELFNSDWANVRSLKAEKAKILTDDFNCYSEGPPGIGEDDIWECTLDYPVRVTLASSDYRGAHRVSDSKQHRMDLQIDGMECTGDSCEAIELSKTVSVYLYRMIAIEQKSDEFEAVKALQGRLREMHPLQLKSATLTPITE